MGQSLNRLEKPVFTAVSYKPLVNEICRLKRLESCAPISTYHHYSVWCVLGFTNFNAANLLAKAARNEADYNNIGNSAI